MGERLRGNEYRTTRVCIDSYEDGVPVGRFYNPGCGDAVPFQSLSQLLIKLNDLLDEMQFPQSFTISRAFSEQRMPLGDKGPSCMEQEGKLATFGVRILFRQNASWQGSVTWLEKSREESFRSALELIFLMNSALEGG